MKLWANVYRSLNGAMGSVFESKELADQMAGRNRLACVEFEFREGLATALYNHLVVEGNTGDANA